MLFKRPPVPAAGLSCESAAAGGWGQQFPALAEFLAAVRWDDGSSRVPGSLTLFTEDGTWKACLSDKDGGLVCFKSGDSPEGVLGALEGGLQVGGLEWRRGRPLGGKTRK
jgi:hypothetical protein